MHKKLRTLLCFFLLFGASAGIRVWANYGTFSNIQAEALFNNEKYAGLHTGAKEFYLSADEKLVIALCNLARFDSKAFIREVIIPAGTDTTEADVADLLQRLRGQKSIFPLMPAFSLYKAAMVHAKDMGLSGKSGHHSSDGRSFQNRIQQFFASNTPMAENYYQGAGDPFDIVMSFLLGKGEKGEQYRINILSENLHYIGVSIQPHRKTCNNAVLDFAQKPQTAASSLAKRKPTEVYWKDCPKGTKIDTKRKSAGFWLTSLFSRRR